MTNNMIINMIPIPIPYNFHNPAPLNIPHWQILLPRRLKKGQHIFSLSLHGSRVCCSNIDKETRDILYKQVTQLLF